MPEGFQPTDDTWYYARVAGTFKERQGFHGCQMPEQLLGRIVRVSSNLGDIVLDPFLGSGTTLMAAERVGRICYGMELDPLYTDTIIRRWQKWTGEKAIHPASGKTFDEYSTEVEFAHV